MSTLSGPQEPTSTDASFTSATGSEDFASTEEDSGVRAASLVREILEQEVVEQVRTPAARSVRGGTSCGATAPPSAPRRRPSPP